MISVELTGDTQLVAKLDAIPARMQAALLQRVTALSEQMTSRIKQKLSGEVLNVRSGNLRDSIHNEVSSEATSVTGAVFSDKSVKYARIHEMGGTTAPHIIEPKEVGGVLAFKISGAMVFARRVNHPGSKIPARPYMRPTLTEFTPKIIASFEAAAAAAIL